MNVRGFTAMLRNRRQRKSVYMSPDFWDGKAGEYEGNSVSLWHNAHLNDLYHPIHVDLLRRHLPQVDGWSILDLGCGTGRLARDLAGRGADVLGVDFSEAAIRIACLETPSGNPRFERQSIHDLDDESRFDAVVMFGVVCVACRDRSELRDVLARIRGALKPHGTVLIFEPLRKHLLSLVLEINTGEFVAEMRRLDFDVHRVQHLHFWPAHQFLCNFSWPRWVTRLVFHLGQGALFLLGGKAMGEFKFIHATRRLRAGPGS